MDDADGLAGPHPGPAAIEPSVYRPRRLRGARWLAAGLSVVAVAPIVVAADDHVAEAAGQTFVVNSVADNFDATAGDGICSIVGSPGTCTFRAALQQANASAGHDRIEFSIPGAGPHRISPASPYPTIVDSAGVTIDGYTQAGSSMNTLEHGSNADLRIELRGRGPAGLDGLYFQSSDNVVQGLAIFDFKRHLRFWGNSAARNEVLGNFIGTDASGTFAQPVRRVNSNGVHIERRASDNLIGKPGRANRNVLSGNGDKGVAIYNDGSDRNLVRNNIVGLSPSGDRLRNWGHGIDINFDASDNRVGGTGVEEGNVLSGNQLSGVEISHDGSAASTTGNAVIGNLIGTNLAGTAGTTLTRNREFGVNLEGKATCPTVASCGPDIRENLVESNTIVGSDAGVMIWKGARDNVVRNNRIGVLPSGTIAPSTVHTRWGVLIEAGAYDNLIDSNVIAGALDGIQVRPDNDYTNEPTNPDIATFGNTFRRNSIWGIVNGFGIDIAPIGSVNDSPAELDADLQGAIVGPTIVTANEDVVRVAGCMGCLVELFTTDGGLSSPYGQGREFVADAVVSAAGNATFGFRASSSDPYVLTAGQSVAATLTDAAGNTSEFSLRVVVAAGPLGPPTGTTTTSTTTTSTTTSTTTTTTSTTSTTPTTTVTTSTTIPPAANTGLAVARRCGPSC